MWPVGTVPICCSNLKNNFAEVVRRFVENGGIYIGQSAGSIVAGPDIYDLYKSGDKEGFEKLDNFNGYGLVDFIVIPHFGDEEKRERFLNHRISPMYGEKYKIILLTDKQYVRVQEDGMYRIKEV